MKYCFGCGDTIYDDSLDQTCQCNKDDHQVKVVSVRQSITNWEVMVEMVNLTRKTSQGKIVFSGSKEDCLVIKQSYILSGEWFDYDSTFSAET